VVDHLGGAVKGDTQMKNTTRILRCALALSLITATPFRMQRIRARRQKPGLARQHLTAVNAAAAVGDDRIQQSEGGGVHPESFTHGSSAQRVSWFKRGFESGRPEDCDTFGGR
jgi:hypothetical protein